jgi:MFS transporter, PAT family, beta-lactamase induction signal transducer AmpG
VLVGRGILYGGLTGATPLIGAKYVGWDVAEISALTSTAGLMAGVLCMTLGGWLGDRFGAKPISILWCIAQMALMVIMFVGQPLWSNPALFVAFVYAWISLDMLLTVAALPISMRLCDPKVTATQFTIYMAISNFGISFGAFMLGQTDAMGGLPAIFLIIGGGVTVSLGLLVFVKYPRRPEFHARQAAMALVLDGAGVPQGPSGIV